MQHKQVNYLNNILCHTINCRFNGIWSNNIIEYNYQQQQRIREMCCLSAGTNLITWVEITYDHTVLAWPVVAFSLTYLNVNVELSSLK